MGICYNECIERSEFSLWLINFQEDTEFMRKKKGLLIPAMLAFSLCGISVLPVLAENTEQTADSANTASEADTGSTSDTPYERAPSQIPIFRANG